MRFIVINSFFLQPWILFSRKKIEMYSFQIKMVSDFNIFPILNPFLTATDAEVNYGKMKNLENGFLALRGQWRAWRESNPQPTD